MVNYQEISGLDLKIRYYIYKQGIVVSLGDKIKTL